MQRANLTVETHAHVTYLLMQEKRIVGVTYVQHGQTREVRVDKEIILCGGAINSPQILMLSGIGPASHLQEHGLPVIIDLPGVGQNLQDHLYADVIYRATNNSAIPDTSSGTEGIGFINTQSDVPAPDVQFIFFLTYRTSDVGQPTDTLMYSITPVGLRPESRGSLTLASSNPFAAPIINPNYLDHEADLQVLVDGVKIARKIGQAKALDACRGSELQPGEWVQTDEALRTFIREVAWTTYHPVGTCKMGHDPLAVVNDRLQVHGVQGLRVVDASIMPTIVSGNTNAPVIMIAEKAADMIKQDAVS